MGYIGHLAVPFFVWVIARAPLACLLAALFFAYLPDADILLSKTPLAGFIDYHRGATHSVFLALVPAALYFLTRRIEFAWGTLGAISHPLIDLVNPYPIMLFWPLSSERIMPGNELVSGAAEAAFFLLLVASLAYFFISGQYKPYLADALRAARKITGAFRGR
jgi:membrane-bound metal-dependent hydrolase YbcI (DUF457 family)